MIGDQVLGSFQELREFLPATVIAVGRWIDRHCPAHYDKPSGVMAFRITLARAGGPRVMALFCTAAGRYYELAVGLMAGVMGVAALA